MKYTVAGALAALAILGCSGVGSSVEAQSDFPVDAAVATMRQQWVHREAIDWTIEEPLLRAAADRAAAANAIVGIFAKADDVHSRVHIDGQTLAHYEGLSESERAALLPQLALEGEVSGRPEGRLLEEGVAYLLVPSLHAELDDVAPIAQAIRQLVVDLAGQAPRGWIVDLRLNGGGNLMPMLLGLAPLLESGATEVVAGTVDVEGRLVQEWLLRGDELLWRDPAGDRVFARLEPSGRDLAISAISAPVAVLIGPLTRSSGQALALSFRGRAQCAILGAPSARGYTTVTAPIDLGQDVVLSLAVGFMADRFGRPERVRVDPEITADATVSASRVDDPAVEAGLAWIAARR